MDFWDIVLGGVLGGILSIFLPKHKSSDKLPEALESRLQRTQEIIDNINGRGPATEEASLSAS